MDFLRSHQNWGTKNTFNVSLKIQSSHVSREQFNIIYEQANKTEKMISDLIKYLNQPNSPRSAK